MINIKLLTVSKKRNSTLRPDLTSAETVSVSLKAPTTEEAPTFQLNWSGPFTYNYCVWGDNYYFIDSVSYDRNDLVNISCTLDVLATFKSYILASTQYVAYSSVSGGTWLLDRRIAVQSDVIVTKSTANVPGLWQGGNYILSVLGENGCVLYYCTQGMIANILSNVQSRSAAMQQSMMSGFDTSDVESALESFADAMTQSDMLGNAFSNAVSCIRSCIWVPFQAVNSGPADNVYLGAFNTGQRASPITDPIYKGAATSISIPWHYTDWRRAYCEDIYLYLPLVGTINVDTSQIAQSAALTMETCLTLSDGGITYMISAGDNIIGTYSGSCAAQYPLGINQQTSYGAIADTMIEGIRKTTGGLSMGSIPSVDAAANAVLAAYEVADVAYQTNPTIIGSLGGGAGSKLPLQAACISVAHSTVVEPANMTATMGVPTQQPLQLSSCSGFCQCVNAHVAAPAHGDALNAIDVFLNSGFFIE